MSKDALYNEMHELTTELKRLALRRKQQVIHTDNNEDKKKLLNLYKNLYGYQPKEVK